ncbi:SDR family NAD(P)-dependent oxidoreductase, partial [Salmonella enterica subsp. enterica]|nr:SDR family NAD(P)-dependent oxidoreductase [Salmonella enterica subsp. enterica]
MTVDEGFRNRLVVLTGARGGLGSTLSAALAAAGARVIGCDLADSPSDGDAFAHFCAFDLADGAAAEAAANAILSQYGCPDILINNAGWTRAETLPQLDGEAIRRELDLNLGGVMRFTMPLVRAMAER